MNTGLGFAIFQNDEFRVWDRGEIVGIFTHASGNADNLQVGDGAWLPLFVQFDDYKEGSLSAGYRLFFTKGSKFKP